MGIDPNPAILAIDQGTSATKAVVVDGGGRVRATAERPLRPRYLPGGGVEQDPSALMASVLDAGRAALGQAGLPVAGVALANQGETVLVWDPASGEPLSEAVVWQDRRAEALCRQLDDHAGELASATGLVLDPYFSAPKMAWLRRHVTTAGVVTTTDTWLIHRLCGAFVTDVSTASRALLLDLDRRAWSDDSVAWFGLGGARLAEVGRLYEEGEPFFRDMFGPAPASGGAQRLARGVVQMLERASMDEIFQGGLHEFVTDFIEENARLASTISEQYLFV